MNAKKRLLVSGLLIPALVAVAFVGMSEEGDAGRENFDSRNSAFTPRSVRQFDEFAVYNMGDRFDSHNLRAILRRDSTFTYPGLTSTRNYVSFIYGECAPRGGQGCSPPFEVQVWPSCVRSRADYTLTPNGEPLPREDLRIRGVPAAFFESGDRLELYTADVTVVIFGQGREKLRSAASALRRVNAVGASVPANLDLPAPAAGALEGTLSC